MFERVLIANRGEIAVRIARACRELGIRPIAVYSDADRDAQHVRMADEAYRLGPADPTASYLDITRIVEVARACGADAVHPGYGFLSENAEFANAVAEAGCTFVGPSADAIRRMGDKLSARSAAVAAGVPVVDGTDDVTADVDAAIEFGRRCGYPVVVKATFGGGGRGMRIVREEGDLPGAIDAARREALAAFSRGECHVERYLHRPRHLEVQVLADTHGNVVHLGDRDCSLQRRHQKLIEEAPAPRLSADTRHDLADAAVRLTREIGYTNAGTLEFLYDDTDRSFCFLEMNTRLQVEHPVTEMVTGIDLVHEQLRIAAGRPLHVTQDAVTIRGHAIEARINAEDASAGFVPTAGTVTAIRAPHGPWVRFDDGVEAGDPISDVYDSMLAKLVVWAPDRDGARARLSRTLAELEIDGVPTTRGFAAFAVNHEQFVDARHSTISVEHEWDLDALNDPHHGPTPVDAPSATRTVVVEVDDRRFEVRVSSQSPPARSPRDPRRRATATGDVIAPLQGTVVEVRVEESDEVTSGDVVAVIEAMKMQNAIRAPASGVVRSVDVHLGDRVEAGARLAVIAPFAR